MKCRDVFFIVDTMGITKTLKYLETRLWWPILRDNVKKNVNSCVVCQRNKTSIIKYVSLLQSLEIPKKKWECVSLGFFIGLTPTHAKGMMQYWYVWRN